MGIAMSFRRFAMTCGPLAGLALTLGLTTSAAAQSYANAPTMPNMGPNVSMPAAPALPALPAAPSLPGAVDMRPVWQGASSTLMPDARTRDAWMDECHRRTEMYYGGSRKRRHHRNDRDREDYRRNDRGYSYCEAYFEDYYRTYAQRGHGYTHAIPVHAMPMMMQTRQPECREVVTTEYVPIRTRIIPRRPAPHRVVPDKRVRDKRMLMD
jgi:hypothetical protein